ncbi:multidrug effflux MFS transporter [Methylovirgula sp. 4M-Z18]|uniref:multidrug effflux MFS transporter n=1 Tax=Methylovirgula sp. 4M-Z18 TaxID=2293567 RepID=UPI000E2FB980|nr:multidrug effflux MFS transporter [Methylovirgula sp. 4M-Z18]RFB81336.1 MFS transporter [Methylovirgula sp. 4M-Z18]
MRLSPGTFAMTATLAMMTALGPLSTDMYLPSLPEISERLHASPAHVQLTLSAFLGGFAVGQIVYGPLSDKFGRKPIVLTGFVLYVVASAICSLAPSVDWLIAARILQAMGAAGPIILARAIVRDLYAGPDAARELSRMGAIMGIAPAIAPAFGGIMQDAFGWRSTFVVSAVCIAAFTIYIRAALPETIKVKQTGPISLDNVFRNFAFLLRHIPFRAYIAINACTYSGLFAFISGSSHILQVNYGLGPVTYGLTFGICAISFAGGATLASRLVKRLGIDRVLQLGVMCLAAGGVAQLLGVWSLPHVTPALVMPMMVYMIGVGLTMPQSMAAALTPFPHHAGAASSLVGFVQMTSAALVGAVVGSMLGTSPMPLPIAVATMGLLALAIFTALRLTTK